MTKFINVLLSILLFVATLFTFVGCSVEESNDDFVENNRTKYTMYIDSNLLENDKIKIDFQKPNCFKSNDNYLLTIDFKITNKEYVTQEFRISNVKLVKEETGSEYFNDNYFSEEFNIGAELSTSIRLSFIIPTSIDETKYKLILEINNNEIVDYLYETPDDLRVDRKVNYYIYDKLVKTDSVKDHKKISSIYVYESNDNLLYCNTWYTDEDRKHKFDTLKEISADINLYGEPISIFKWSTTSSDVYSFLNGINYVPSNGILVIPETYQNKELCIGLYAIKNVKVTKIYVPKSVHTIYSGNFTGIGNATIYYAGTKEEWAELFYNTNEIPTSNVVFNISYGDF